MELVVGIVLACTLEFDCRYVTHVYDSKQACEASLYEFMEDTEKYFTVHDMTGACFVVSAEHQENG